MFCVGRYLTRLSQGLKSSFFVLRSLGRSDSVNAKISPRLCVTSCAQWKSNQNHGNCGTQKRAIHSLRYSCTEIPLRMRLLSDGNKQQLTIYQIKKFQKYSIRIHQEIQPWYNWMRVRRSQQRARPGQAANPKERAALLIFWIFGFPLRLLLILLLSGGQLNNYLQFGKHGEQIDEIDMDFTAIHVITCSSLSYFAFKLPIEILNGVSLHLRDKIEFRYQRDILEMNCLELPSRHPVRSSCL
jgi:hypothetical protein